MVTSLLELETDEGLYEALDHLGDFYSPQNDEQARSRLLGDIERRSLQSHRKFLQNFEQIYTQLAQVESSVSTMRQTCDNMEARLNQTNSSASRVITRTQQLHAERDRARGKQILARAYLEKFQLTERERGLLTGPLEATGLSVDFFSALKRVQEINSNAKELLREQHPNAEIAIKDALSLTQQAAYDKLFRWIQQQFPLFYAPSPDVTQEMSLGMEAIKERPVLLQHCLDGIIKVRNSAVFDAFMNALQRGGPNGVPKPIEVHAHDPYRFVGDMLGCVHQLLASEVELLGALVSDHTPEEKQRTERILSRTLEGVCQPLKVRVEQVLLSKPGVVTVFRLANLLDFYARTMGKALSWDSPLIAEVLNECKRRAMEELFLSLTEQSEQMLNSPPNPPASLSPPSTVHQILNNLMEIMAVFDSSLVPQEQREKEFTPILLAVLEPLLKSCTLSATVLSNESDMAVFMINCLGLIQNSLAGFSFSLARGEELREQIDAHMDTLITEESRGMLHKCKLGSKLEIFQDWEREPTSSRQPLSYVTEMDTRQLSQAMRSFEECLLDISTMTMPQCERLFSSRLKTQARSKVFLMIIGAYTSLFQAVINPSNKYESPSLVVPYQPEQLRTMLLASQEDASSTE
jgi:conserved oligomeric Golgi complex subunit 6